MAGFLARRLLLGIGVLLAVSFGTFALISTKFSSQCLSRFTPTGVANPPLASNVGQATRLYWDWLGGIPSGRSFGTVCGSLPVAERLGPAFGHTAALLAATGVLVVVFALAVGTVAATRAGSALDAGLRGFSYAAWAVPPFVLALVLQSVLAWAARSHGFTWFPLAGWSSGGAFGVLRNVTIPAVSLAFAFVGLHSRYLRSSLLVALNAPYTTTARAKGLPERTVVLRHALRNSLATFTSALLLDFGAIFGAAMAVDAVFHLDGLGSTLLTEIAGVGGGDGPRFLNPYAIETLLAAAAAMVIVASLLAEVTVSILDPRSRTG